MIKLEQIHELNEKVQSTLEVIRALRDENDMLRGKLEENENRVKELEVLVSSFRQDQDEMEEGIKGVLLQLDRLEEEFTAPPAPRSEEVEAAENTPSEEEEVSAPSEEKSSEEDEEAAADNSEAAEPSEAFLGFSPAAEAVSSPVEDSADEVEGFIPGDSTPGSTPSPTDAPAAAGEDSEGSSPDEPAESASPENGETELDIF